MNLWHILEHAARECPEQTAVICEGRELSYRTLAGRSSRLGAALPGMGVTAGKKAGILSCNCTAYIEIIFALMKIGAVAVPLNCRLTAGELETLAGHAGLAALFYSSSLEDRLPGHLPGIARAVCIHDETSYCTRDYEELCSGSAGSAACTADESSGSCILYTAGTTGTPKGVVLTHGAQIWNTLNYTAACSFLPDDIELAPTQLFHASTYGRVFTYIFNRIPFVLCTDFDPAACIDIIRRRRVTSVTQSPTMYAMMREAMDRELPGIRRAVTGASTMHPRDRQALADMFPRASLFDIYGMTEAGPGISCLAPHDFFRKPASVGQPMLSVEVAVAGTEGSCAPQGETGEIMCRGPNPMRGYYNDPAATEAALAEGWLHTGDIGYMDDEGFVYISGRKKDIVISGGENIFPGEIEAVLMEHPAVCDAAVFGVPDERWGERVTAAVVRRPGAAVGDKDLLDFCRSRLAGFKRPRMIVFCEALPRNAAQKVLKNVLLQQLALEKQPGMFLAER